MSYGDRRNEGAKLQTSNTSLNDSRVCVNCRTPAGSSAAKFEARTSQKDAKEGVAGRVSFGLSNSVKRSLIYLIPIACYLIS